MAMLLHFVGRLPIIVNATPIHDYNVRFRNRHRQLYAWNKHLLEFGRCVF